MSRCAWNGDGLILAANARGSIAARILLVAAALLLAACAVDPARLPRTYLLQAQDAVAAHDATAAMAALDRAEALWLSANYYSSLSPLYSGQSNSALRDIGNARSAVQFGRWDDAGYYVRTALSDPSVIRPGY